MAPIDWPEVPEDLVAYLEAAFPPRCKKPSESLEEHVRYAGCVELVEILRARAEMGRVGADDGDLDDFTEAQLAGFRDEML